MTPTTHWSGEALPLGQSIDRVLYDLRRDDAGERLLLDSACLADITEDSDGGLAFDALVMPYAQMAHKMELLNGVMQRSGQGVKPVSFQVSEPFKQSGTANVATVFELSDGQTVSVYFHNPDVTPGKMAGTDEVISWKWLLNKKDITLVVAPERGDDLNVREVARRVMKLAEKNSAAFQRANGKRAETLQRIEGIQAEVAGLEKELKTALSDLEGAKFEKEEGRAKADDFLKAPDGSFDFGEITAEQAKAIKRQAGKIRLQQGDDSYGARHIELRHGKDIRGVGFKDIAGFVSDALRHIDAIWKPSKTSQLVMIEAKEHGKVVFVELKPSDSGDFYTVNSAFPTPRDYAEKKSTKNGWVKLWGGMALSPSAPAVQIPSAEQLPAKAGGNVATPSGQSLSASVSDQSGESKAEDIALPYSFASATPQALYLLRVAYNTPTRRGINTDNAYASAVKIENSAKDRGFSVEWEAIETLPTFDSLFPNIGSSGYLKGTVKYGAKIMMTVSVRGDGEMAFDLTESAIVSRNAIMMEDEMEEDVAENFEQWVSGPTGAMDWAYSQPEDEGSSARINEENRKREEREATIEANKREALNEADEFGKTKRGFCGAVTSGSASKEALSRKPAGSFTLVVEKMGFKEENVTFGFVMFSRQKLDKSGRRIDPSGKIGNAQLTNIIKTAQLAYETGTKVLADYGGVVLGENKPDLSYRAVDSMFTMFYPNTKAGEDAWRSIAEQSGGTGKVLSIHVADTIRQLEENGYTVSKDKKVDVGLSDNELLEELYSLSPTPAPVPAVAEVTEPAAPVGAEETGAFGPIYSGYENKPEAAIAKLMAEKQGEVPGAFHHPELGDIAFVYGDAHMGLRHIKEKRGIQYVSRIPDVLRKGRVVRDDKLPRAYLVTDDDPPHVVTIRLDFDGKEKTWVITSFDDDRGKFARQARTSDVPPVTASPRIPDATGQTQSSPSVGENQAATEVGQAGEGKASIAPPAVDNSPSQDEFSPEGRESKVKTAKGTEVVTGFSVVEAGRLITSHSPETGDVNPEFPQELQPRDRGRETSRAWVMKTAANLDPEQLGKTRRADTGAPIVGPDRVVESGNGRTMAIIEAYRIGKAGEYREWLESEAEYFGLSADKIKAMNRPVLVRVRSSSINRAEFSVEANQDDKLAMTATEKARSDANRLTESMISLMTDNGDLSASSNIPFLAAFLTSLGDAEAAQYSTREGKPTSTLIARVQAAIFAKAYNDDRLLDSVVTRWRARA